MFGLVERSGSHEMERPRVWWFVALERPELVTRAEEAASGSSSSWRPVWPATSS